MCVLGTAACAFVYGVCQGLNFFVAGGGISVFSRDLFVRGAFLAGPGVCIVAQIFMVLLVLRRQTDSRKINHLFSLIVYIVLALATWCVLFPKVFEIEKDFFRQDSAERSVPVSSGYFRESSGGVYYYSKILPDGSADGILIDTQGKYGNAGGIIPFASQNPALVSSFPYSDVLVKDAVQTPAMISVPLRAYSVLREQMTLSFLGGKMVWFSFATLGLALLSLYGLQFSSSWKMVGCVLVVLGAILILVANYLFYAEKIPESILLWQRHLPQIYSLPNSLIVYANLAVFVVLFLFGAVFGILRVRKMGREGDE